MLDIRIQPTDDQQYQDILDTLRPMGVEVVTGEGDPLVAALFYVARINSKLDNLGQLRHLHKGLAALEKASERFSKYFTVEERRNEIQAQYKLDLFHRLVKYHNRNPLRLSDGKLWMRAHDVQFLTDDQIHALFDKYHEEERATEI